MIEKLKQTVRGVYDKPAMPTAIEFFNKINELVDTVNALVKENNIHEEQIDKRYWTIQHRQPADPYAEQRKWIGCVCRFWYDDPDDPLLDYLGKIQTGENGIEYYGKETYDWFPHCEPIKPDDDIIYKGE